MMPPRARPVCHEAQAEHHAAHRDQLGQAELQADGEHQEQHPHLGEHADLAAVRDQAEDMRAERHAGEQIADHRRQAQAARDHHREHAARQHDQHRLEGNYRMVHGLYSSA
jgi:hypothetical protein